VAAHVEPDLLIVDEVLSVGDYLFQQKCVDRMNTVLRSGATVIFVSHNLHAVAGHCRHIMLKEKGHVESSGPTDSVIREYLARAQGSRPEDTAKVEIKKVTVRRAQGGGGQFTPGEVAFVDVVIAAREDVANVTTVIQIVDDNFYPIFDTDTARLSGNVSSLRSGEELEATFALDLHLAAGTYHINAFAHEYVTDRAFSTWRSAATFFVGETRTVKGRAHLYPTLTRCTTHAAPNETAAMATPPLPTMIADAGLGRATTNTRS
jgi:lipopolysaccharide transport system ATP-binding protein